MFLGVPVVEFCTCISDGCNAAFVANGFVEFCRNESYEDGSVVKEFKEK